MSAIMRLSAAFLALFLWQATAHADLNQIKKAAEAGDAEKQLELGILYEYGFGYKGKNQVPALTWYMIAAEKGVAMAAKHRDGLQAKLTADQVRAAREEAEKLKATMTLGPATVAGPRLETPTETEPVAAVPADKEPAGSEAKPAMPATPKTTKPEAASPGAVPATTPAADETKPAAAPAPGSPAAPEGASPKSEAPASGTTPATTPASAVKPAAEQPK